MMSTCKLPVITCFILCFVFSLTGVAQTVDLTQSLQEFERSVLEDIIEETEEEAEKEELDEPEEIPEEPPTTIFDIIDRRELSREIVFDPEKDRDIFVLPWVVDAVNATRLLVLGEGYMENRQYDEAIRVFSHLISQYSETDQAIIARGKVSEAREYKRREELARARKLEEEAKKEVAVEVEPEVKLPPEVLRQISAVIWDNGHSYMLYRHEPLRIGEALPDYPDITVHAFSKPQIYFRIHEETLSLKFQPDI